MNIEQFVEKLEGSRRRGDKWEARCPAHDDHRSSLSIATGDDGRVLAKCHAGCRLEEIVEAMGITMHDLFAPKEEPKRQQKKGKIVATYDYLDEEGELLYQVVRFDPKDFRQRRPDGDGWSWTVKDVRRVPYRLPELDAAPGRALFIVEGEKDADALARLGLLATTNAGGAGKWDASFAGHVQDRDVVILPDNDRPGRDHAVDVARKVAGVAKSIRIVELPGLPPKGDVSDWLSKGGKKADLLTIVKATPTWVDPTVKDDDHPPDPDGLVVGPDGRVEIILEAGQFHVAVRQAILVLARDYRMYERALQLVTVARLKKTKIAQKIERDPGAPVIIDMAIGRVRTILSERCSFLKWVKTKDGPELKPCDPPPDLVIGIMDAGEWPEMRQLIGLSSCPIVHADGSVHTTPGYDEESGIIYTGPQIEPLKKDIGPDDIKAALDEILEVVCDVPWCDEIQRIGWLSGLLTSIVRPLCPTVPIHGVDATTPGSGKSLTLDCLSLIVSGRRMARGSYVHDDDELRKRILSHALTGDREVLIDNVPTGASIGWPSLDAAVTGTEIRDRQLGVSRTVTVVNLLTWYLTGNNMSIKGDTGRRCIISRIEVDEEHPEQRTGFKHPYLMDWIIEERARLLRACLTLLSGYLRAGAPKHGKAPLGSFERWDEIVRGCLIWSGLGDPVDLLATGGQEEDPDRINQIRLLFALSDSHPQTTKEILTSDDPELQGAAIDLCGREVSPRVLGYRLRAMKGRIMAGRRLCVKKLGHNKDINWFVDKIVKSDLRGDRGDAGSSLTPSREAKNENKNSLWGGGGKDHPASPRSPRKLTLVQNDEIP